MSQLKYWGAQSQDSLGNKQDALVFSPNSGCPSPSPSSQRLLLDSKNYMQPGTLPIKDGDVFSFKTPFHSQHPKPSPHALGPPKLGSPPPSFPAHPHRGGGLLLHSGQSSPSSISFCPPSLPAPHTWLLSADTSPGFWAQRTRRPAPGVSSALEPRRSARQAQPPHL